jgi:hypothetical protein
VVKTLEHLEETFTKIDRSKEQKKNLMVGLRMLLLKEEISFPHMQYSHMENVTNYE